MKRVDSLASSIAPGRRLRERQKGRWSSSGWWVLGLLILVTSGLQAQIEQDEVFSWLGSDGELLPFKNRLELEDFLRTARVTAVKKLDVGVTQPRKLTLEADGIRMHAVFRYVEAFNRMWKRKGAETVLNFYDSCTFELAAYRLDQVLGMNRVPPTVAREFSREDFEDSKLISQLPKRKGTVQAWVEQAQTERNRVEEGIIVPRPQDWVYQLATMRLFDCLIYNLDRNQGNILIDANWRIWLIDATRAFRPDERLNDAENIRLCERSFWQRLNEVTNEEFREALDGILGDSEVKTLLVRREKLVAHLNELIQQRGERRVIVDYIEPVPRDLNDCASRDADALVASPR
jgi:hypothetical protein